MDGRGSAGPSIPQVFISHLLLVTWTSRKASRRFDAPKSLEIGYSQTFDARTILPVILQVDVFRLLRGSTCWSARRGRRSPFQKKCLERIAIETTIQLPGINH